MPNSSPSGSAPPYSPPQHLVSHWTAAELTSMFQGFLDSLRYVQHAPELVFERLVGSLNQGFDNTAKQGHAAAEQLRTENKALQGTVDQLRVELAALHGKGSVQEEREIVAQAPCDSCVDLSSISLGLPATISHSAGTTRLVFDFLVASNRVFAFCKTPTPESPVPPQGCTWGEIGFPDPEFQFGHGIFRGTSSHRLSMQNMDFAFNKAFLGPATVVVWLTHITHSNGPLSLSISALGASAVGFHVRIDVDKKSLVEEAGIAWVAYPASRKDITSGFRGTTSDKDGKCSPYYHSEKIVVDLPKRSVQKVFVAVNALDMDGSEKFTMQVRSDTISGNDTSTDIWWDMFLGPPDACLYSAGISYLTAK